MQVIEQNKSKFDISIAACDRLSASKIVQTLLEASDVCVVKDSHRTQRSHQAYFYHCLVNIHLQDPTSCQASSCPTLDAPEGSAVSCSRQSQVFIPVFSTCLDSKYDDLYHCRLGQFVAFDVVQAGLEMGKLGGLVCHQESGRRDGAGHFPSF